MTQSLYRISVEHNGRTNVVTREYRGSGDSWITIAKYTTQSFSNWRRNEWEQQAQSLLSQPSAAPLLPHEFDPMMPEEMVPAGEMNLCMLCGEPRNNTGEGWTGGHHITHRREPSPEDVAEWLKGIDKEPWAVETPYERHRALADAGQLTVVEVMPTRFDRPQSTMTQAMWDADMGCSVHRAHRSGSCHDCAMLQPDVAEMVRDEVQQTVMTYHAVLGKI